MNKKTLYRILLLAVLFTIRSLPGWGNDKSLPHLSFNNQAVTFVPSIAMDTVPAAKPAAPKPGDPKQTDPAGPVGEVVKPVIKQIPKSKKQLKPIALPGKVPVKTPKVIKPKVIIRKIGGLVP